MILECRAIQHAASVLTQEIERAGRRAAEIAAEIDSFAVEARSVEEECRNIKAELASLRADPRNASGLLLVDGGSLQSRRGAESTAVPPRQETAFTIDFRSVVGVTRLAVTNMRAKTFESRTAALLAVYESKASEMRAITRQVNAFDGSRQALQRSLDQLLLQCPPASSREHG